MTIAGVILAGGFASRMGGGDKCLCQLGAGAILDHIIARLGPQVEGLALNANGPSARFALYAIPVVPDTLPGYPGPLAGILAGLNWAASAGFTDIVTVPGDTPFIARTLVNCLVAARTNARAEIAVATSKGQLHPTIGLWSVSLASDIEDALLNDGLRRVIDFLKRHQVAQADFQADLLDPFFNINEPADLVTAARLLSAAS